MSVLMWDKPQQVMSKDEWMAISADSAPPGVYVSNMSEEDKLRWKAKLIAKRTDDPRVEIRTQAAWSNLLIVLRPGGPINDIVTMSMNGPAAFDSRTWIEFNQAISEGQAHLQWAMQQADAK